jgi:hypothetical protein
MALEGARRFFERCGFSPYARFVDFVADAPLAAERREADLVSSATVEELRDAGALEAPAALAWERSAAAIEGRKREIEGLAIASDVRVEALLLFRSVANGTEILRLSARRAEPLAALVGALQRRRPGATIAIPKVSPAEIDFSILEALGFQRRTEYMGWLADVAASRT